MQRFWHGGKLTMIDQLIRPHLKADSRLLEIGCGAGNLLLQASVRGSYPVALDLAMQASDLCPLAFAAGTIGFRSTTRFFMSSNPLANTCH